MPKQAATIWVRKKTIEIVNPHHLPEGVTCDGIEEITKRALYLRKANRQLVYVMKGTTQEVDPHRLPEGVTRDGIEEITKGTLRGRKEDRRLVYVMKGTIQEVDPHRLPEGVTRDGIEEITTGTLSARKITRQLTCVIKGTTQEVDPHRLPEGASGDGIEEITKGTLSARKRNRRLVYVMRGTTQEVDPHRLPEGVTRDGIEEITKGTLCGRKEDRRLVYVMKGTIQEVDPHRLPEGVTRDGIEEITKGTLRGRKEVRQLVYVMRGTTQEVDPHRLPEGASSDGIEEITKGTLRGRKANRQLACVMKGTTQEVDPHRLPEGVTRDGIEEITKGTLYVRKRNRKRKKNQSNTDNIDNVEKRPKNQIYENNGRNIESIDTSYFPHEVVVKQEPCELNTIPSLPPLSFNELREVAKILRGNSIAENNCSKYTMAFMEYFSTREKPHGSASSEPSTRDDFSVCIKTEGKYILRSEILREHPFFPCNEVPIENSEGVIDVDDPQVAEEVDYYVQASCDIQLLEKTLKSYAEANEKQESYGIINFAHPIKAGCAGHSVNYYATPAEVYLIDCQLIYHAQGEAVFPIKDLKNYYCFEGDDQRQKDYGLKMFQKLVFIAPHVDTIVESSNVLNRSSNQMSDAQIAATIGIFGGKNIEEINTLALIKAPTI